MLKKLFDFDPAKHSLKTEIAAGITTFLTMAYILAVNPEIFSNLAAQGMDTHAVFTATTLAAIVGTVIMAVYAKKPFGLAPGMGLNAFFVFTICLTMGYPWQMALTAVFIEGIIFILSFSVIDYYRQILFCGFCRCKLVTAVYFVHAYHLTFCRKVERSNLISAVVYDEKGILVTEFVDLKQRRLVGKRTLQQ